MDHRGDFIQIGALYILHQGAHGGDEVVEAAVGHQPPKVRDQVSQGCGAVVQQVGHPRQAPTRLDPGGYTPAVIH